MYDLFLLFVVQNTEEPVEHCDHLVAAHCPHLQPVSANKTFSQTVHALLTSMSSPSFVAVVSRDSDMLLGSSFRDLGILVVDSFRNSIELVPENYVFLIAVEFVLSVVV